jgi:hypothetical protein
MLLASILGFRLYLEAHYEMKLQGYPQKSFTDKHSSLFCDTLDEEERMLCKIDNCGQCYKTFYSRKLRLSSLV